MFAGICALLWTTRVAAQGTAAPASKASSVLTLHLFLSDASGNPVPAPSVQIHVTGRDSNVTTDKDGVISIELVDTGPTAVDVLATKFCRHEFKVIAHKNIDLALMIPKGSESTCVVVPLPRGTGASAVPLANSPRASAPRTKP
jgi:hypothetical protein